ncbi:hypothetical protein [Streptomyces sp. NPDC001404]|uniref:hypothetical protein n=1 Tax=Streptomyces sp. NPDC001404 TaxID=3364571 RepID=UPI003682711B
MPGADPAAAYWGTATTLVLHMLARGRLLPGVSPGGFDAWRIGPYDSEDRARLGELAAAMPPEARAVPLQGPATLELPQAEPLLRAFMDAVADVLARTPAGPLAAGSDAWTGTEPQAVGEQQREWAAEVASGLNAGVGVSLRIELPGTGSDKGAWDEEDPAGPGGSDGYDLDTDGRFGAVVQLHHLAEAVVAFPVKSLCSG